MKMLTVVLVVAWLLVMAPLASAQAPDPNAPPATLADLAKGIQGKMDAVRKPGEVAPPPFLLSHFVKPPPPPKREDEPQAGEAPITLPPEIKCNGVMNMGAGLVVLIGSGSYTVGEQVAGAKITRITQSEVWFQYRGKPFKLPAR
jgi:hypothetical protein